MIFNVSVTHLKRVSVFLKFNDNNVCIESFKDHNHLHISEPIINRQKFNNNKKIKALGVICVRIKNI